MGTWMHRTLAGAAAGAAGTAALNAATYLDIAVRGRAPSTTPERTVEQMAQRMHVQVPGDEQKRKNRLGGLGPLMGIVTGLQVGVAGGLAAGAVGALTGGRRLPRPLTAALLGLAAMAGSDGTMTALGVTDPRRWPASSWAADVVPHLAYGAAATGVLALAGEQ